jgi:hypothetical protein
MSWTVASNLAGNRDTGRGTWLHNTLPMKPTFGVVDALVEAILEGAMANYAPDIVSFDLDPPLQYVGAQAKAHRA